MRELGPKWLPGEKPPQTRLTSQWLAEDVPNRWMQFLDARNQLADAMNWSLPLSEKLTNPEISRLIRKRNFVQKNNLGPVLTIGQEKALDLFIRSRESYRKGERAVKRLQKKEYTAPQWAQLLILESNAETPLLSLKEHPLTEKKRDSSNRLTSLARIGTVALTVGTMLLLQKSRPPVSIPPPPDESEFAAQPTPTQIPEPVLIPAQTPVPSETEKLPDRMPEIKPVVPKGPDLNTVLLARTPHKYRELIMEAAQKYDIPARLISVIIDQESSFDPEAISDEGSIGLGGFQPGTAKELGINPLDPEESIFGVAAYLAKMRKQFDNWPDVLAAYNAGPGTVEKYQGIPPYRETRNYVVNALRRWMTQDILK